MSYVSLPVSLISFRAKDRRNDISSNEAVYIDRDHRRRSWKKEDGLIHQTNSSQSFIYKEKGMFQKDRSKHRSLNIIAGLLVLIALFVSACGPPGTPTTSASNSKPVRGGTWVDDLVNEPDSLIPNASVQTFSYIVDQALYTPLFTGTSTGQIQPALATEIPTIQNGGVNADATVWTFHLRPNLKWSDGQPLNADDVDFTWKLWQNPQFAASNTTGISDIQSATVSPDKLSITFHLKTPFSPFLTMWTDGIQAPMPAHYYKNIPPSQIKKSKNNLDPSVVSGPFEMKESVPGDHYTLVRNPDYYLASQGLPYLNEVVFRPVSDQTTILKDLQSNSIDSAWFLDASKIPAYKQLSNYQLNLGTSAGYEALHFNENNPALKDINVRTAISYAIDRDSLIKVARQGAGISLCTDHTSVYNPGYQANVQCPSFDLAKANQILDQAGWKMGPDGVREKNGMRLEFKYSTTANNTWREEDETINQANFKKIGIKLDIVNYPSSTFFSTFLGSGKAGQYDIAEWETSYPIDPDDSVNFSCSEVGKSNFNWYCNPQLDALFKKEESTADPTIRQQTFNQIHAILLKDLPVVSMYSPDDLSISAKGTHNYKPGPFGATETVNIANWWCDGGTCPTAG
jgi:peptide/nickel transport system substrate-binding protein